MALSLNTQGVLFSIQGDFRNAIIQHQLSLRLREQSNDLQGISNSNINIGNVYYEQGEFEKAVEYFEIGMKTAEKCNNQKGVASTLNNLGIIFREQGHQHKALEHFTRALVIKREIGDQYGIANTLGNIGGIYSEMGEHLLASNHFQRSFEIQKQGGDRRGMAGSLMNIGHIYTNRGHDALQLGNEAEAEQLYDLAQDHCSQALDMAKDVGAVLEIRDAAKYLYSAYRHNGHYKKAMEMHVFYIEMRDSIENIEMLRSVLQQELEAEYEKKKSIASIDYIRKQKEDEMAHQSQMHALIGLFLLFLVLSGGYLGIKTISKRAEREILLHQIQTLKAEAAVKRSPLQSIDDKIHLDLDERKIEAAINGNMNSTDWKILHALFHDPGSSNREIAESVSLSIDGVRSSLRKMYRLFDLEGTSQNQRITLIIKASKISNLV